MKDKAAKKDTDCGAAIASLLVRQPVQLVAPSSESREHVANRIKQVGRSPEMVSGWRVWVFAQAVCAASRADFWRFTTCSGWPPRTALASAPRQLSGTCDRRVVGVGVGIGWEG